MDFDFENTYTETFISVPEKFVSDDYYKSDEYISILFRTILSTIVAGHIRCKEDISSANKKTPYINIISYMERVLGLHVIELPWNREENKFGHKILIVKLDDLFKLYNLENKYSTEPS